MAVIIIIFGSLVCLGGLVIIINPEILFGFIQRVSDKMFTQILAIAVRLLLGALFISQAALSRYPVVIEAIGWLSIVAALTFTVIGRTNFVQLMTWVLSRTKPFARVGGFVALVFGSFLVYAFV
ncbi:MAG: hypothetical protein V7711_15045 [Pseudomonadales bacterium]